jgi:CBS domain-containing protein
VRIGLSKRRLGVREEVGRPFAVETVRTKGGFMQVKDIMSKTLFRCTPVDSIQKAAELMKANNI